MNLYGSENLLGKKVQYDEWDLHGECEERIFTIMVVYTTEKGLIVCGYDVEGGAHEKYFLETKLLNSF